MLVVIVAEDNVQSYCVFILCLLVFFLPRHLVRRCLQVSPRVHAYVEIHFTCLTKSVFASNIHL